MIQMKPIHKLNGGDKATLCKVCRTIIDRDFTEHLLCPNCQEKAIELVKYSYTTLKREGYGWRSLKEFLNEIENENI